VSSQRHHVLILLGSYLPGYIRSIESVVATLGEKLAVRIVTQDRGLGENLPYPGGLKSGWVRIGEADVMYLRPGFRGLLGMWALLRAVDRNTVLYLTSFFAWRFSMLPVLMGWLQLCRPRCVLLTPHGEFSPEALRVRQFPKFWYIRISRWLGLYQGLIWHASSGLEAAEICRQFPLAKQTDVAEVTGGADEGKRRTSEVAEAPDSAGHHVAKPVLCPKCNSDRTHRSHRRRRFEQLVSRAAIYPYRCRACGHRFLTFHHEAPDEAASTPTVGEILSTRRSVKWRSKRLEFFLYGAVLLLFLAFLYYITREHGGSTDSG
jgi:predicted Zn-ribbon and HTH transcriptional regulator